MEQTSPQSTVVNSQSVTPVANLPETKPHRKARKAWIISAVVILTVLALAIFGLAVINRGQNGEKSNYFNKIKLGRTTSKEVKNMYGEPAKIASLGSAGVYLYPATTVPFMHQIVFNRESDKVLLVNEFIGGNSDLTLNGYIKRYRKYDRELFTTWGEDSRVYIFSKPGLLLHVDAPTGRVIEIGYFSPGRENEIIQIMGKNLLEKQPEHF